MDGWDGNTEFPGAFIPKVNGIGLGICIWGEVNECSFPSLSSTNSFWLFSPIFFEMAFILKR
jgi:hypothetical protein